VFVSRPSLAGLHQVKSFQPKKTGAIQFLRTMCADARFRQLLVYTALIIGVRLVYRNMTGAFPECVHGQSTLSALAQISCSDLRSHHARVPCPATSSMKQKKPQDHCWVRG